MAFCAVYWPAGNDKEEISTTRAVVTQVIQRAKRRRALLTLLGDWNETLSPGDVWRAGSPRADLCSPRGREGMLSRLIDLSFVDTWTIGGGGQRCMTHVVAQAGSLRQAARIDGIWVEAALEDCVLEAEIFEEELGLGVSDHCPVMAGLLVPSTFQRWKRSVITSRKIIDTGKASPQQWRDFQKACTKTSYRHCRPLQQAMTASATGGQTEWTLPSCPTADSAPVGEETKEIMAERDRVMGAAEQSLMGFQQAMLEAALRILPTRRSGPGKTLPGTIMRALTVRRGLGHLLYRARAFVSGQGGDGTRLLSGWIKWQAKVTEWKDFRGPQGQEVVGYPRTKDFFATSSAWTVSLTDSLATWQQRILELRRVLGCLRNLLRRAAAVDLRHRIVTAIENRADLFQNGHIRGNIRRVLNSVLEKGGDRIVIDRAQERDGLVTFDPD
ncbi:hypothetical protein HDU67_003981, partial [Dinochytrium kinnereticum]